MFIAARQHEPVFFLLLRKQSLGYARKEKKWRAPVSRYARHVTLAVRQAQWKVLQAVPGAS